MPDEPRDTTDADEQTTRRRASRKETVPERQGVLGHLSDDDVDWLEAERDGVDASQAAASIVKMERVRQRNPYTWARLTTWAAQGSRERVRLLRLLVEQHPFVTYQDAAERLDVSDRRIRDFVKELRDAGIVETPGRPAQIRFVDDDTYLVGQDVAAYL